MSRSSWLLVPVAAASLAAGVAVAGPQSSETTPVTGDFQANLVNPSERVCDASHSVFRGAFQGSLTSSDARLSGDLTVRFRSVVNTGSGWGRTVAKVTVRETGGGHPKFRGRAVAILEPDGGAEGFLSGRTVAKPHVQLLANINIQQDQQTGAITGELGKDTLSGTSKDPAILTNACRGGQKPH
jgi:hypothetical protein